MSSLTELNTILDAAGIVVETGVFSSPPPVEYIVLTPLIDQFSLFGDNRPQVDVQEVRISLFCKTNYMQRKAQIEGLLLAANFTITDRRYVGHEDDTGYHHYAIDVAKEFLV
ncbi:MAG: hypothetical protein ACYCYM_08260 [Saccharofermentanales bacterium]